MNPVSLYLSCYYSKNYVCPLPSSPSSWYLGIRILTALTISIRSRTLQLISVLAFHHSYLILALDTDTSIINPSSLGPLFRRFFAPSILSLWLRRPIINRLSAFRIIDWQGLCSSIDAFLCPLIFKSLLSLFRALERVS